MAKDLNYRSSKLNITNFKTWDDLTTYSSFEKTKFSKVGEENFKTALDDGCYFFAVEFYDDHNHSEGIFMLKTTYKGEPLEIMNKNGEIIEIIDGIALSVKFDNALTKIKGMITKHSFPWEYNGKGTFEDYENIGKNTLSDEAYELSSELFSFKEMRRGIIEHGKTCYIEGYKKHSELFSTFLVKNGYFSDKELHKVIAEFDAYLNETPAISIRTCEDILKKTKIFTNMPPKNEGYPLPSLNICQKDIVTHYCDTLNYKNKILRISKSRQKGVSTILSIIAYLETQNGKRVLYIGCSDPRTLLGLKFNHFFTYKHSLTVKGLLGDRFDLIIVDDPNTDNLECFKTLVTCIGKNGKMIVALTPCGPKAYAYNEIKAFFKKDCGDMFTYFTGPSDGVEKLIERSPKDKNEFMGKFID